MWARSEFSVKATRCHYERIPNIQTTLVFNFNAINQNFGAKKNDNKLVSKLCPSIWSTIITPFFPIKTDKNTQRKNYALSQLLSELWIWINLILLLERMFHLLWNDLMAIAFHSYRNRLDSFRYVTFRFDSFNLFCPCVSLSLTCSLPSRALSLSVSRSAPIHTHPFVHSWDFQFPVISHQQWLANKLNYRYKYHHHHRRHSLAWIHTRYCYSVTTNTCGVRVWVWVCEALIEHVPMEM